jgi:hypothetical protein
VTEAANEQRSRDDSRGFSRAIRLVLVFAVIGPFVAGSVALVFILAAGSFKKGLHIGDVPALLGLTGLAFNMMPIVAYVFGTAVAVLTGLITAITRAWAGPTTVVTPLAAATTALGISVLINAIFPGRLAYFFFPDTLDGALTFLVPSWLAAVVCWTAAKRWNLA